MKVAEYIAEYLKQKGVKHIFGYQGGGILPFIHAINKTEGITYIQNYHEQAAGFAADGYSRINNNLGVALATNGPGATNLVSAIANAFFDYCPCLFITGQVNVSDINTKNSIRQNGFQEVNTVSMVKSLTKYSKTITDVRYIRYELDKAITIAQSCPKGAVLLDIPLNIQNAEIEPENLKKYCPKKHKTKKFPLNNFIRLLEKSQRPLILAGGGLKNSRNEFEKFIEITGIPRVSTLCALDIYSENNYGFCGLFGNTYSDIAINKTDLLIVMGSRLSKRQIGIKEKYAPNAKIIQIDINKSELNRVLKNTLTIQADIKDFLNTFLEKFSNKTFPKYKKWVEFLENTKKQYYNSIELNKLNKPVEIVRTISSYVNSEANIIFDVGQNQMWCSQGFIAKKGQHILTSAGLGCMGYSLPAAIGAYYANFNNTIAFCGDGGFQMNIQELQFISSTQIPVKCIVFNNQSLGMIQEVQMKFQNQEYYGTKIGYSTPDIKKLAQCYGINYILINRIEDLQLLKNTINDKLPYLIEIKLNENPTRLLNQYDEVDIYE